MPGGHHCGLVEPQDPTMDGSVRLSYKVRGATSSRKTRYISIIPGTFANFQELQVTVLPLPSRALKDYPFSQLSLVHCQSVRAWRSQHRVTSALVLSPHDLASF